MRCLPVAFKQVERFRDSYRQDLNCQIVRDSFLPRGFADAYLLESANGRAAGYGAVSNRYDKGRIIEFYVVPAERARAAPLFRELLAVSAATHIEAQTNNPLLLLMLYDCAKNIKAENYLFADAHLTHLACPAGARFRPDGEKYGIEAADGRTAASGGFLCHYNPPYGDLYMETHKDFRRQGYSSYLLQELKRVCYEAGKRPAARCNADNAASRRTLERAGMLPCARLLAGKVRDAVA
jgi:GNAT superfamily N-acetyltransferase